MSHTFTTKVLTGPKTTYRYQGRSYGSKAGLAGGIAAHMTASIADRGTGRLGRLHAAHMKAKTPNTRAVTFHRAADAWDHAEEKAKRRVLRVLMKEEA